MLFPEIKTSLAEISRMVIDDERKEKLKVLEDYLLMTLRTRKNSSLNFICTHNSRRSQFAQAWSMLLADHFSLNIASFSGGVEETDFYPSVGEALTRDGFVVSPHPESGVSIQFRADMAPVHFYSKLYDKGDIAEPPFAAAMTCAEADENCPFIPGAEMRIPLNYKDPKASDGTEHEADAYFERSRQIASELFYTFYRVKQQL
ncbi:MAG: protein-tyrosine-phosphatase [Flavobacteriia bacterium]|nr:protein-tyrosine-phosphatase [Flavobacteriia bacterium]